MVSFSKVFLMFGSICLVSPVMAAEVEDDYDDGDYSAAPVVYKYNAPKKPKQVAKKVVKPAAKPAVVAAEVDDDDDGDYSAAPVVYKYKASTKQKPHAKATKKAKVQAQKKQDGKTLASAKAEARAKWNKRSVIDPFE